MENSGYIKWTQSITSSQLNLFSNYRVQVEFKVKSEKMKTASILFVVASMAACVFSQAPAPLPPAVATALDALKNEIKTMHTSDTFDAKKLGAGLTAVGAALQPTISSAPQAVQDEFKALQTKVQALSTGTPDKETAKQTVMSTMKFLESLFPGAKELMHPDGGPKKGPNNSA